jgi:hypothetical protein
MLVFDVACSTKQNLTEVEYFLTVCCLTLLANVTLSDASVVHTSEVRGCTLLLILIRKLKGEWRGLQTGSMVILFTQRKIKWTENTNFKAPRISNCTKSLRLTRCRACRGWLAVSIADKRKAAIISFLRSFVLELAPISLSILHMTVWAHKAQLIFPIVGLRDNFYVIIDAT